MSDAGNNVIKGKYGIGAIIIACEIGAEDCAENSENENEIKRSRFEFINKINDKMESFEKNRNEYSRESMKLAIEEANKLAEQKAKKEKNKRKKKK